MTMPKVFPVGCRVTCVMSDGTAQKGDLGTVIGRAYSDAHARMVGVLWDEHHERMHDFGGALRPVPKPKLPFPQGHCWYVPKIMIEPVEEINEDEKELGVVDVHGNTEGG